MHSSSYEQILEKDGFSLSVPEGSKDIRYFRIFSDKDSVLCQVSFEYCGDVFTYRGKRTSSLKDISGLHYTWDETSEIGDVTVFLSSEGPETALWYENGISFALMNLDGIPLERLLHLREIL